MSILSNLTKQDKFNILNLSEDILKQTFEDYLILFQRRKAEYVASQAALDETKEKENTEAEKADQTIVAEVIYTKEENKISPSTETNIEGLKIEVKNFAYAILEGAQKQLQENLFKLLNTLFINVEEKVEEKTSLKANSEKVKISIEKENDYVELSKSEYFTIYEKEKESSKIFDILIVPNIESPLLLDYLNKETPPTTVEEKINPGEISKEEIETDFEEAVTPVIRKINKFKLEDFFPEIAAGTDGLVLGNLKTNFQLIKESYQTNPSGFVSSLHSENTTYPKMRATFFTWWFHEKLKADNSSLKEFYRIFARKIEENNVNSETHPGIIGEIFIQTLTEAGSSFAQTTGEILSEWNSIQPNSTGVKVGEAFIDTKIQLLIQNENSLDSFTLDGQVIDSSPEPLEDKPAMAKIMKLDMPTVSYPRNIRKIVRKPLRRRYKKISKELNKQIDIAIAKERKKIVYNQTKELSLGIKEYDETLEGLMRSLKRICLYKGKKFNPDDYEPLELYSDVLDKDVFVDGRLGDWCGQGHGWTTRGILKRKVRSRFASTYKIYMFFKNRNKGNFKRIKTLNSSNAKDYFLNTLKIEVGDIITISTWNNRFYGSHFLVVHSITENQMRVENDELKGVTFMEFNAYDDVGRNLPSYPDNAVIGAIVVRNTVDLNVLKMHYKFLPEDFIIYDKIISGKYKKKKENNLQIEIKKTGTSR